MNDEPLHIEDLNSRYYVRRRTVVKIIGVVMFITTITYLVILISYEDARRPSATGALVSMGAAWSSISFVWNSLNAPLVIYRDRIEYLNRVIPLSRIERITRAEEDGRVKFWIKAKGWWPRMFFPRYFKCDPGSSKCAAFDALMNEFESAGGQGFSVP